MKTRIFKMLALTVLAFVVIFISSSRKVKAAEKAVVVTHLKDVKHLYKIAVMGNVEVYLSQGAEESVKVYDDYYSKNALVQWQNGELRIASFEKEKLVVQITVTNLGAIEASGESLVRTMNQISAINLDIRLKGNAVAQVEARAVSISSLLTDGSKLELSGESENQHIALSGAGEYEAARFVTQNRSMVISDQAVASINQDGSSTLIKAFSKIPEKELSFSFDPEF